MLTPLRAAVLRAPKTLGIRGLKTTPKNYGGGTYVYRSAPAPPPYRNVLLAELGGTFMFGWITYRMCIDWRMVLTNEWPRPDPSAWSNEELGILPLDEEDPEVVA